MKLSEYKGKQKKEFDFEVLRNCDSTYHFIVRTEQEEEDFLSKLEAYYPNLRNRSYVGSRYYEEWKQKGWRKYLVKQMSFGWDRQVEEDHVVINWSDYYEAV